jgi:hypothetical protein
MKTNSLQAATSKRRILILLVLMVLSTAGMFGQEVKNEIATPITSSTIATVGDDTTSQMEFVSWFMASKQVHKSGMENTNNTSTKLTSKKQFINNGLTPNRILSRAFLKKAINSESTIA